MTGLRLRRLTFTGSSTAPAELTFEDGLNIVYGASNTGKSFALKAILFMLGVSKQLPENEEISAYSAVWLGVTLPNGDDVTLFRATKGGGFKLYSGLVSSAGRDKGEVLRPKHDSSRSDSVSQTLLSEMGLKGKQIVRDASGTKDVLSIYYLSPYAVVSEEDIIAEKSPVYTSGIPSQRPFEKNLFKLLITGVDDSDIVTVPKPIQLTVAKAAKIELVDEWIAQLDEQLGENPAEEKEVEEQVEKLTESINSLSGQLQEVQENLDVAIDMRRRNKDYHMHLQDQAGELTLTLQRFNTLQAVYDSDLQRLQSVEEGGYILVAIAGMDCSVCGAPPEAHTHNQAAEEISRIHSAAAAESRKIEREKRELAHTIASLQDEETHLNSDIDSLILLINKFEDTAKALRPQESSLRGLYELYTCKLAEATATLELYQNRAQLVAKRLLIDAEPTKIVRDKLPAGPNADAMYHFGETVKSVLTIWGLPNADKVQFNGEHYDITVAGKRREANGKGVRAILHAAFNVAVIVYCIENKLPHPGFLVLDTPLLTYREPLDSRHGDLAEDEVELKKTSLAEKFYRHLASLKDEVQFIVIENSDPPAATHNLAHIETFTGLEGSGRFGLLAVASDSIAKTLVDE